MTMTPQELKSSILQMAIQGKLVEQREEEGTAEELYKQIQEEKQRLIDEGKIKKQKEPLRISEDETPFDIPDSWKWVHIEEVTYPVGNKKNQILAKDVKVTGTYPAVSQGAALIDGYSNDENRVIHDIPVIMFGDHTRNVKLIDFPFVISADGTKFMKCVKTNEKYLFYLLQYISENLKNRGYARHYSLLKKELLPLPPLEEQKRIVAKIEELLPLIDKYEKAWTKLEEFNKKFPEDMQKSILQMAIQGKLVEQREEEGTAEELYMQIQEEKQKLIQEGKIKKEKPLPEITEDEIPFDIPDSWKWVKLGDVTSYAQTKQKIKAKDVSPKTWMLDMEDIEKGGRLLCKKSVSDRQSIGDKTVFSIGDILYAKLRPYLLKIIIADEDGICTPELVPFIPYGDIDKHFLLYYLKSPYVDSKINEVTYGVKMPRVGTDTMVNLLIPLPPLEEQKRIVAKIEELLPLCERLK